MSAKIAIAIIHGAGITRPDYADDMIADLKRRFAADAGSDPDAALVFRPIFWEPVLRRPERELWARLQEGGPLDFALLRQFIVDFMGDTLAYQPGRHQRDCYEAIHSVVADGLRVLADIAGRDAPLVVIAHSLGTIIGINFFHDLQRLQKLLGERFRAALRPRRTPLEKGETLTCFFTLGSPLALWSLRFRDFGTPLTVPSPKLGKHHPDLVPLAVWENYYDPSDVIAYPLKTLNAAYARTVTSDVPVKVGGLLTGWNPLAHRGYLTSERVSLPLASRLVALWRGSSRDPRRDRFISSGLSNS